MLAAACPSDGRPTPESPSPAPDAISVDRYLDDRSDAVQVVRSVYNAVNRHEYARSYSYWEPEAAAEQLPPYAAFKAGYQETASVELETGTVTGDAGARQLYYRVPVVLTVVFAFWVVAVGVCLPWRLLFGRDRPAGTFRQQH